MKHLIALLFLPTCSGTLCSIPPDGSMELHSTPRKKPTSGLTDMVMMRSKGNFFGVFEF